MAKREVRITIDQMGKSVISAHGYEGGTCLDATQAFENMFAKQEGEREMVGECAGGKDYGERVR